MPNSDHESRNCGEQLIAPHSLRNQVNPPFVPKRNWHVIDIKSRRDGRVVDWPMSTGTWPAGYGLVRPPLRRGLGDRHTVGSRFGSACRLPRTSNCVLSLARLSRVALTDPPGGGPARRCSGRSTPLPDWSGWRFGCSRDGVVVA